MKKQLIIDIISFLLILLFVYAGVSKLADYQKFRVEIGKSPLITSFASWVAWFVPTIEIIISLMLATRKWRLWALYASFSLMVMFTVYIISILKFSSYIPCSCGGILQDMTWGEHLKFNIGIVVLSLLGIILESINRKGITKEDTLDSGHATPIINSIQ